MITNLKGCTSKHTFWENYKLLIAHYFTSKAALSKMFKYLVNTSCKLACVFSVMIATILSE